MATFDGWEAQLYGPNTLAHFRTKGSKNGVRRFQNEDGTWTPLGLRERKEREGWGSERKARRAEKKAARAERKAVSAAARKERIAAYKEEKRKNNLKTMTDEELKSKIARVKMEMEYKELTRNPLLKVGENLVGKMIEAKAKKAASDAEKAKIALEKQKIEAEVTKSQEQTKKAAEEAKKAESESKSRIAEWGSKAKLKEQKKELINAKKQYRETTLRGAITRALGISLTAGKKDRLTIERKALGEKAAAKIRAKGYKVARRILKGKGYSTMPELISDHKVTSFDKSETSETSTPKNPYGDPRRKVKE